MIRQHRLRGRTLRGGRDGIVGEGLRAVGKAALVKHMHLYGILFPVKGRLVSGRNITLNQNLIHQCFAKIDGRSVRILGELRRLIILAIGVALGF